MERNDCPDSAGFRQPDGLADPRRKLLGHGGSVPTVLNGSDGHEAVQARNELRKHAAVPVHRRLKLGRLDLSVECHQLDWLARVSGTERSETSDALAPWEPHVTETEPVVQT